MWDVNTVYIFTALKLVMPILYYKCFRQIGGAGGLLAGHNAAESEYNVAMGRKGEDIVHTYHLHVDLN